ncbi:MAG TPA: NYN domain-containing protein [Actinomycetota bacterium]|nr:NYN domain-containing protein [Actinomycetota bacterium]
MARVAVYVDGFNLYFGLKAKHGRRFLWLDLQALAESLLRPRQTLERVTYFTARVRKDPDAARRQSDYLDALACHSPLVTIVDGRFQERQRRCWQCGSEWLVHEEKETDVNIAVALVEDAVLDRYDTALLISADSDLCPAIGAIRRLRPEKRIVGAFPPKRESGDLRRAVDGLVFIGDDKIRRSQLPPVVVTPSGIALRRPKHWA